MKVIEAINILERAERQLNSQGRPEDIEINHLKNYLQEEKEVLEEL